MDFNEIKTILGPKAESLLDHTCTGIPKDMIHFPGPDFIERVMEHSDRNNIVLNNMNRLLYLRLLNTLFICFTNVRVDLRWRTIKILASAFFINT